MFFHSISLLISLFSNFFPEKESGINFFHNFFFLCVLGFFGWMVGVFLWCLFVLKKRKSSLVLLMEKGLAFWTLRSGAVQVAMGERIPPFKYCTKVTQHREVN